VLDELIAENLLSEARYAEMLVHSRVNRGYGPLRILAEAQDVGADEALIRQALDEAAPDWLALAQEAHRKRFGAPPKDFKERVKQARFLASRGFSASTVSAVLGEIYE
jgi:regulatory protein